MGNGDSQPCIDHQTHRSKARPSHPTTLSHQHQHLGMSMVYQAAANYFNETIFIMGRSPNVLGNSCISACCLRVCVRWVNPHLCWALRCIVLNTMWKKDCTSHSVREMELGTNLMCQAMTDPQESIAERNSGNRCSSVACISCISRSRGITFRQVVEQKVQGF